MLNSEAVLKMESLTFIFQFPAHSEGESKEPFLFDSRYAAAWALSYSGAAVYYPLLSVFGRPLTLGDVLGRNFNSTSYVISYANFPQNNPERKAFFVKPYPDAALPGVSLISAIAPFYFTGRYQGYDYDDVYISSLGIDIAISSVSSFWMLFKKIWLPRTVSE
jgi:hypothetical protein